MRTLACLMGALALAGLAVAQPLTPMTPDLRVVRKTSMVPVRPVAELIGATITVAGERVTIARWNRSFTYVIGRDTAVVNGKTVKLPEKTFQEAGVSYVPLRPLAETFGATLVADTKAGTVTADVPGGPRLVFGSDAARNWSYYDGASDLYAVSLDGGDPRRLTYHAATNDAPAFSPDGTRMVFTRNGDLYLRDLNSPNATLLWPADATFDYTDARFSPDGAWVYYSKSMYDQNARFDPLTYARSSDEPWSYRYEAYNRKYQIFRIRVDGTGKQLLAEGRLSRISPDGTLVAYVTKSGRDGVQTRLMQADGTEQKVVGTGISPRFSPDGTYLVFGRRYERGDGKSAEILTRYTLRGAEAGTTHNIDPSAWDSPEHGPVFSPDGARVAYCSGGLCIMKPDHTEVQELTIGDDASVPVFTRDGMHIIYLRDDELVIVPVDGGEPRALAPKHRVHAFALAPDGQSVIFSGTEGRSDGFSLMMSELGEGDPACTPDQALAYLDEVMPLVEKAAGKPFLTRPVMHLVSRTEITPLLTRELLPQLTALLPGETRADTKATAYRASRVSAYGLLGKCGVDDNVLYVLPRNLGPLMKAGKIDGKHATAIMKLVIAHEAAHVLQGQYVSLPKLFGDAKTAETMMALAATTEGQAGYIEDQVADALGVQPAEKALAHAFASGKLDDASPELGIVTNPFVRLLGDIYLGGQQFVAWHIKRDGPAKAWAILAAPPTRTSVIYRPETYGATVADGIDYQAALAGLEKRFGDRKWRVMNQEIGEMALRSLYGKLDAATRDKLVGNVTRAQNLVASADDASVGITIFALADPAGGPLMLQTLEDMLKMQFTEATSSGSLKIDPPVYADFTGPKIDAGRRVTFTVRAFGETSTLQIVRVLRGGMVVELYSANATQTDEALHATLDELYARLLRKGIAGVGG